MTADNLRPIAPWERIQLIDVLRGFALACIFIGNMQWFSGYGMTPHVLVEGWPLLDRIAAFIVHFAIDGKFYSIFSFLFGFGFALQIARAKERGDGKASVFKRRLFWLLIIGLLHAYLLWAGDILSIYAVTGFVLLLFRKKSDRSLLKWAFWLLLIPIPVYLLIFGLFTAFAPPLPPEFTESDPVKALASWQATIAQVSTASFFEILTRFNPQYIMGRYIGLILEMRFAKLLAMFLLGCYAQRKGILSDDAIHDELTKRVLKYGFVLGLIGNAVIAAVAWAESPFPPSALGVLGVIGNAVGVAPLALAFIAAVKLLWQRPRARRILNILAPAGRMALTNYLMQTVIAVLMFYGYGLGLYGSVGPLGTTLIAVLIFSVQVMFSSVWLRFFNYGPMEWVWRQLTYKKVLPLRRVSTVSAQL
jgi:uncharacterized protein